MVTSHSVSPQVSEPRQCSEDTQVSTLSLFRAGNDLSWASGHFPAWGLPCPVSMAGHLVPGPHLSPGLGHFFPECPHRSCPPRSPSPPLQENLMLSILPKHVADEMLKDMKKDESQKDQQQFNTMYMYRHENVRCAGHGPGFQALDGGFGGSTENCGVQESSWGLETHTPSRQYEPQPCRSCLAAGCWGLRWAIYGPGPVLHRHHTQAKLEARALNTPWTCQGPPTLGPERGPGCRGAGEGAGGRQPGARLAIHILTAGPSSSAASSLLISWASHSCPQPAAPRSL